MPRYDSEIILDQWKNGSRLFSGSMEGVVEIVKEPVSKVQGLTGAGEAKILVRVRGPLGASKLCFYFLEEILGLIDQVYSAFIYYLRRHRVNLQIRFFNLVSWLPQGWFLFYCSNQLIKFEDKRFGLKK